MRGRCIAILELPRIIDADTDVIFAALVDIDIDDDDDDDEEETAVRNGTAIDGFVRTNSAVIAIFFIWIVPQPTIEPRSMY